MVERKNERVTRHLLKSVPRKFENFVFAPAVTEPPRREAHKGSRSCLEHDTCLALFPSFVTPRSSSCKAKALISEPDFQIGPDAPLFMNARSKHQRRIYPDASQCSVFPKIQIRSKPQTAGACLAFALATCSCFFCFLA